MSSHRGETRNHYEAAKSIESSRTSSTGRSSMTNAFNVVKNITKNNMESSVGNSLKKFTHYRHHYRRTRLSPLACFDDAVVPTEGGKRNTGDLGVFFLIATIRRNLCRPSVLLPLFGHSDDKLKKEDSHTELRKRSPISLVIQLLAERQLNRGVVADVFEPERLSPASAEANARIAGFRRLADGRAYPGVGAAIARGTKRQVGAHEERQELELEKLKLMNANRSRPGRSSLNNQEMAYAREAYEYNKSIEESAKRPSLVQWFAQLSDEGCTQTQFIEQAKRYLENRYKLFMQTANAEHLRHAHRDGILSILNLWIARQT
ncbi:nuclear pore complex protein nup93 [Culex quinquefasciatus]|uniref:Nuclear pore complex protein nup93 n=1 Tax=Culex quinquefasciatus TaxID=7176 RepID=B0W5V3_CULQU|nr:nuclear pore complex protein nup93 [Culex quinquefasciatus]|eukprot:XP_001844087.1 nuclear pore complex protein nup93 [Culex quinquefasciatus]